MTETRKKANRHVGVTNATQRPNKLGMVVKQHVESSRKGKGKVKSIVEMDLFA